MNNHRPSRIKHQIRIIGGRWRGRKIPVPDLPGLRPTGDRQRETLFNWLAPYIDGARVLDAFSGSGALGLEALSRGAANAVLLDSSAKAVEHLKHWSEVLATTAEIHREDAIRYLRSSPQNSFDLVFLDPPFDEGLMDKCIEALSHSSALSQHALVYLEQSKQDSPTAVPVNWILYRENTSGEVAIRLYRLQ